MQMDGQDMALTFESKFTLGCLSMISALINNKVDQEGGRGE